MSNKLFTFGNIKNGNNTFINTSNNFLIKSGIFKTINLKNLNNQPSPNNTQIFLIQIKGYKKSKSNIKLFLGNENNTNNFQKLDDNWTFISQVVYLNAYQNNYKYGIVFEKNNVNDLFFLEYMTITNMNSYFYSELNQPIHNISFTVDTVDTVDTESDLHFQTLDNIENDLKSLDIGDNTNALNNYQEDLITILMPVHNVEKYIEKAILSITKQTYKKWELIIIDDNSTDNTFQIIKKYTEWEELNKILKEKGGLGIKYIKNYKNFGKFISMNKALLLSKGRYITVIDGDDLYHKDKLAIQLYNIKTNNIPYTYCNYIRFTNYNQLDKIMKSHYGQVRNRNISEKGNHYDNSAMYDKKIINKVGFYDSIRFGGDTEFRFRMYQYYKIPHKRMFIKKILYYALSRPGSLITSEGSKYGSDARVHYQKKMEQWHSTTSQLYMDFPLVSRPFLIHPKNSPFL